jgi:hypothetical protein
MLEFIAKGDRVHFGSRFSVSFYRTLRLPDDGHTYPLPPGLGSFPVHCVADLGNRAPESWRAQGGVFLPIQPREAMWMGFRADPLQPTVVKVGVGRINAVTGDPWNERLQDDPQDYLVCPGQLWLDGINVGRGVIRQFVAMPLGKHYTVEAQVTGEERFGDIQILAFAAKPGRYFEQPAGPTAGPRAERPEPGAMGLGAGGRMKQKIYPDPYGLDAWDEWRRGLLIVHLVNAQQYQALTGLEFPWSPVTAETYAHYGLPWFEMGDEAQGTVPPSGILSRVKSVEELDDERGQPDSDASIEIEHGAS